MERFHYLSRKDLEKIPKTPGVYALCSLKEVLYIGKAASLRERVKTHFHQPSYRDRLFLNKVNRVGYIPTQSDIDALILESQLIKRHLPKYNVMWKDDKKYFYVAITKEPLPRVSLTHQPILPKLSPKLSLTKFDSNLVRLSLNAQYIGPFVEGKPIKKVLKMLRRAFPYYTAKKHPQGLCSWCHLNLCPGPSPNPLAYRKNIGKLIALLQGKKTRVLKDIEKEMKHAAKAQNYERAAVLRDQFLALERIVSHARLISPNPQLPLRWSRVQKTLQKLLGSKKLFARVEAYDISNIQGKHATGSQVTFLKGVRAKDSYRKYKIRIAGKPDDFAMMKELITRRLKHPEWPYPDLMIIDGGKGQLSSALQAIQNLAKLSYPHLSLAKLQRMKVMALAKRENELFFPGKKTPVLLRNLPKEAENFFLAIRDEAHRFAISYHRKLRSTSALR